VHDAVITSQFLRREKGDRPEIVPPGSTNLAFVGQFCELPADVVFTVEYSIRSAQTAVYSLLGLKRRYRAVYKGQYDRAFCTKRSQLCMTSKPDGLREPGNPIMNFAVDKSDPLKTYDILAGLVAPAPDRSSHELE